MKRYFIILLMAVTMIVNAQEKQPKIGLCLSGGGALGFAHIGVLCALEENGIKPHVLSGASMGAIVAALYATGLEPQKMLEVVKKERLYRISTLVNPSHRRGGMFNLHTLRKLMKQYATHDSFDSLKYELYVAVSNINTAQSNIIGPGMGLSLSNFVAASASVPFVFEPVIVGDTAYVDGGLFNNLPTQILKKKCDVVIGVDVLPYYMKKEIKSRNEVLTLTIRGVEHHNAQKGRELCDYLIEPDAIYNYHEFSFDKYKEIYQNGYDKTLEFIKSHPEMLELKK